MDDTQRTMTGRGTARVAVRELVDIEPLAGLIGLVLLGLFLLIL